MAGRSHSDPGRAVAPERGPGCSSGCGDQDDDDDRGGDAGDIEGQYQHDERDSRDTGGQQAAQAAVDQRTPDGEPGDHECRNDDQQRAWIVHQTPDSDNYSGREAQQRRCRRGSP